jgi:methionine synthase I (cobalamin-dependent)
MRPMVAGSDRNNLMREWPEEDSRRLFTRKARGLKDAGADLIMMEMMRDGDYAVWATESAVSAGLPVWCGISVEKGADGELYGWGRADCRFEDFVQKLAAAKPAVINIMHTSPNDTGEALRIARKYWSGPLGTYPESGYFTMPDWQFVDIIAPAELVSKSRSWKALGASIFGGCCGIGPDHIRALSQGI